MLFTGWASLTGRPVLLVVPVLMLCGFAFVNIPARDRYLSEKYGDEYRVYVRSTARLVPFLY